MPFPTLAISQFVEAGYPMLYLVSWEEERVEKKLKEMAESLPSGPRAFYAWSCTGGLRGTAGEFHEAADAMEALDAVAGSEGSGFFLFKDLHHYFGDPRVIRKIKDTYSNLYGGDKTLFMLSPVFEAIPPDLERDVIIIDIDLPDAEEISSIMESVIGRAKNAEALTDSFTPECRAKCVNALLGLGEAEVKLALRRSLMGRSEIDNEAIEALFEEKAQIVKKSGALDIFQSKSTLGDIGGLENLKDWLRVRSIAFTGKGKEHRLDKPKGLLVMGVSGCGKSLCAKAVATAWSLPLIKLDLNQVYSGVQGSPEESFRKAIKTVEAVSPCVLWIDEIEAGITRSGEKTGDSPSSRIFGYFLTWMQEKTHDVFIAATANQIDLLPPEILRKGRFDEIFFVSLPTERERREILDIHLRNRGYDLEKFDLASLAKNSEGLSGAELEQAVISATYEALANDKELDDRELVIAASSIVPLSTTMREDISKLERWASNRATKASRSS